MRGIVNCDPDSLEVSILFCYCMTYNHNLNTTVVGSCLLGCRRKHTPRCQSLNQIETNETSELNHIMCGDFNREGQVCGKCRDGYGLPVYSYSLACVNCTNPAVTRNILKYIAVTYLPLTAFYIFIITFKISVTSGNMVAYVLTCQILTMPSLLRAFEMNRVNTFLLSWFTIWNLDLLHSYPEFCIHPSMSTLQVLALDYMVGVYPLLLILLTYSAVVLHDRYSLVVKIWKPAYRVLMCVRREWNIRGTLVQAFATFLVLSYVKILNVSFDLLTPLTLKTAEGKSLVKTYLYNDGEIVYFGERHRPYGILAILMMTTFNILPTLLLLLYPCHFFQKCLNCCGLNNHVLQTFMDVFQGCYRHQPRYCRCFPAFYFIMRILFLVTTALVKDPTCFALFGFYWIIAAVILVFAAPYKANIHNKIDIAFFLLFATVVGGLYVFLKPAEPQLPIQKILVAATIPFFLTVIIYGLIIILQKITPRKLSLLMLNCYKSIRFKAKCQSEASEEPFPYRFEHHNENSPLLK